MSHVPYPTHVDVLPAISNLLAFVKGQGEVKTVAKDAWEVSGYALGQFLGEPDGTLVTSPKTEVSAEKMTDEEALQHVQAVLSMNEQSRGAISPAVWKQVFKIAVEVLSKFLDSL